MNYEGMRLEIAKIIKEPLNTAFPVPVDLSTIATVEVVEAGEIVYHYNAVDATADVVLTVQGDGSLTSVKRNPVGITELNFIIRIFLFLL